MSYAASPCSASLMANMPLMMMSAALNFPVPYAGETTLDIFAFYFVRAIGDTKFITIFSILFGAGLQWTYERAEQRGRAFVPTYLRRLGVLALIGAIHFTFIWFGDILFHYALFGFIAMWMRRLRVKTMLITAAVLLLLTGVLFSLLSRLDPADFNPRRPTARPRRRSRPRRCNGATTRSRPETSSR